MIIGNQDGISGENSQNDSRENQSDGNQNGNPDGRSEYSSQNDSRENHLDGDSIENRNNDDNRRGNSGDDKTEDSDEIAPTISFTDVKDALKKFKSGSKDMLEKWIKEFDKVALTSKWDEVQKFLFALKLLEGEAAAVAEATESSTYDELLAALRRVFKKKTSLIAVHKDLSERKKKPEETMVEYMFKMKTLDKVETPSVG